nr:hypothetical protein [uncultured Mediterranean phage uvMED]BAR25755.1 hypothetical protein [uncultured Mediterranean phage uvMED]
MAISGSGAVALSTVQSEFGGGNPISMSEYYSGGFPNNFSNTGSSTAFTPTGKSISYTYTYQAQSGKNTVTLTATQYFDGFCHTSINSNFSGSTQSITVNKFSGVDKTGNSGAIPSSGTIDMNKFRGTSAGTNTPFTIYGILYGHRTAQLFPSSVAIFLGGHLGSPYNAYTGQTYSGSIGMPCSNIYCSAEGNAPATTFYNGTQSNNGRISGPPSSIAHNNNSTIGNYTGVVYMGNVNAAHVGGFSGGWNITVNH